MKEKVLRFNNDWKSRRSYEEKKKKEKLNETLNTKEKWNWKLEEKNTMYTDSFTSSQPSKSHTTNTYTDITP